MNASERHPRGLYTLFFTEMWERFSYYGMRALLMLFMVDAVRHGGLGLTDAKAAAVYGLYTAGVYLAALPGGWVADRLLGAQNAVWHGGIIIAIGQFTLAIPRTDTFYVGLVLVVIGTGLLKPNVSAIVGQLYPEGGARRDAGFTLFYMGINLGAFIGPLISGWIGESKVGTGEDWQHRWHYGFATAGVGMLLGLVQYRLTRRHLGAAGTAPSHSRDAVRRDWTILGLAVAGLILFIGLVAAQVIPFNPVAVAEKTNYFIAALAVAYFAYVLRFQKLTSLEKKRVAVIAILFVAAVIFFAALEQAGSSLNLFADRHTQRVFAGREFPASWFQSFNPLFVLAFAPLVALLWPALAHRGINPPLLSKFAFGMFFAGFSFLVMVVAARYAVKGEAVLPTWLISSYLLMTIGELFLSPVGLSSVTKLAPQRLVGQMMGLWFLATSLGNLIAGLLAGKVSGDNVSQMPGRFLEVVVVCCVTGAVLLLLARPMERMAADSKTN